MAIFGPRNCQENRDLEDAVCAEINTPSASFFNSNKKHSTTHQKVHRFCVLPPLKNHPSKAHRFCVLPPLKNHPSKPIGSMYSPLWKVTHRSPSVLCTPPFEKSPIVAHRFCVLPPLKNHPSKAHRFCVLPPLKNHPSKPIGFVYSPLWKALFLVGAYFWWAFIFDGHLLPQIRYI